jgi:hypothetical protein
MSDPVQLAKQAREKLAAALSALQAPGVPDDLVAAAEPVAQAMGVLHRIERTNGANLDGRKEAVAAVRDALSRVQLVDSTHPAVEIVMEAIAGSLSKVHALSRYEAPQATPVAAPPAVSTGNPGGAPQTPPVAATTAAPARRPTPGPMAAQTAAPQPIAAQPVVAVQPAPQPVPQPAAKPAATADVTLPLNNATLPLTPEQQVGGPAYAQQHQRRETPAVISPEMAQAARAGTPVAAGPFSPAASSSPGSTMQSAQPTHAPAPAARPSEKAMLAVGSRIDVELGTHSTSNFYKGLGGNDVIEHGGIFIATYKVMKINAPVTLRVLLPGDYEFTATAVVQWTREAGSSEPGYGARFTQISPEGRQLVYRYTRNREPMFYDDL